MHRTLTAIAATALWITTAQADAFTEAVVAKYQDMGFDFVEIQNGVTQVKVEAIRGSEKIEVIYDRETGKILKQETERAGDDSGRTGVQVSDRDDDFLDDSDDDSLDNSGYGSHDDDDDYDDNGGSGSHDDDDDYDDDSDDSNDDDSGSDDDGDDSDDDDSDDDH